MWYFPLVSNLRGNAIRLQISLVGENYILLFLRIPFFEYHTIMRVNYGDINYWKLFINEILLRR